MSQPLPRNDLRAADAPQSIEIFQLTSGDLPASHIYMEAQIFTPDSKHFILHESATPHGSDRHDPAHRYLFCDLSNHSALRPITHELGTTAPAISPDGKWLYYFIDETETGGGKLSLNKVGLDGTNRETLFVLDTPLPGTNYRPSRIYPLSTIRSDEKKIALSCFLGDGQIEPTWGLMVFDLDNPSVELILQGPSWCNVHPQYCRSTDTEHKTDLLIQENHGNQVDATGAFTKLVGGRGADIHVIRDDGTHFRDLPWGRDNNEFCQGHQCWRGQTTWAITSTSTKNPAEQQLIESQTIAPANHIGISTPGGKRNDLSRRFNDPSFYHFATDQQGNRCITDTGARDQGGRVFIADLQTPGQDPLANWTCLAHPGSSWTKEAHIHPFLSPDGTKAFFNSDESGLLQAYMICGL